MYGHLGTIRHRADVVEHRVEQHAKLLADRLAPLYRRFGGRPDTTANTAASSKG
ncbi:MAG: hypothetical protein ABI785_01845 [Gemmatimonadales bacterium]